MIDVTEYAINEPYLQPRIIHCPQEYLITIKVKPENEENMTYLAEILSDHFAYCEKHASIRKFPLGSIILQEDLKKGYYEDRYYFSQTQKPMKSNRLFIKPAGWYAVQLHKGGDGVFLSAYENLLSYLNKNNWQVAGNAYVRDLLGYLTFDEEEKFVMEIAVQVEKRQ